MLPALTRCDIEELLSNALSFESTSVDQPSNSEMANGYGKRKHGIRSEMCVGILFRLSLTCN